MQQFIIQNFQWDKESNLLIASMDSLGITDPPYEFNIIGRNGNTVRFERAPDIQRNIVRYICEYKFRQKLTYNQLVLGVHLTYGPQTP